MKRIFFSVYFLWVLQFAGQTQDVPNSSNAALTSPTSAKASQLSSVPVNIFTGVPNVSVPIYSYNNGNNGLSLGIGLSYFAGGTQVAESPNTVGLGWFLSAGGAITRTVRGRPDDLDQNGFLFSAAIPTDFRSNGSKYYYDSLDAQQDIFQYSFNGQSGKFFIGKNQQVVVVPASKIRVIPTLGTGPTYTQNIISFRIITEDGIKYDFKDTETNYIWTNGTDSSFFHSGYSNKTYNSSWYLSQVISSFNTDTIKFTYSSKSTSNQFSFPQTTFVRNSDGIRTVTYTPTGGNSTTIKKISSVLFPDKTTVSFVYDTYSYSADDKALWKIKISDTIFRYGYKLDYQTTDGGNLSKLLLKYITPYTAKEVKAGYQFFYNSPIFPSSGSSGDTLQNKRDHWGFYNGANNGNNLIPKVNSYTWGANRDPNPSYAIANSLKFFYLPSGGHIVYEYELNDHFPYIKDPKQLAITANSNSTNAITLNQVFNSKNQLVFRLSDEFLRTSAVPISGSGNLICNLYQNVDELYATYTLSLYDLFYQGIKTWTLNAPNGNYNLHTQLSSGTTISGTFPIAISWENKLPDVSKNAVAAGGLRVKKVSRFNAIDDPVSAKTEEYKYITEDGKSSGFLGDIPKYDYPYQEKVNYNGTTTTGYTAVSSEPVSNMNYAQGSPVGYSRVEIIKGTASKNLGKTVYEFTGLQDINSDVFIAAFPYTPQDTRDWGIGLPKKISVYDSTGRLVKRTINTIAFDTIAYQNSNFKSVKLGHSATTINGNPANSSTPKVKTYIGQEYYPLSGRTYVTSSTDTLFQKDSSLNASTTSYTYDTNYNVTKIISGYDRNRGLQLEQRIYYPYNYTIGGAIGKLRDSAILSAVVAKENWIIGDANPRILSGEFTSFKQLATGHIKADTVYALESNKPIAQATITVFNAAKLNRNTNYIKPQLRYLNYDSKGNMLEAVNLKSGQSSSVIMDYGQQYAIAQVSNASNSDIAYSSFESDGSGNWTIASTTRDFSSALTGKKSYNLSNGNITKSGLSSSKPYLLTLWLKSGATATVNGAAVSNPIASQSGWNLYSVPLSSITSVTISGTGLVDELRLHPKDANMTTSTYEPMIGVTSMADANNTVVYNEYDNLNRLKLIRDKDKNIIKRYDYSDVPLTITTAPDWGNGAVICGPLGNGVYDSTYKDLNPYSDTYGYTSVIPKTNGATCCTGSLYKMVNGVCQLAERWNTSTTYMKINNPNGPEPPQIWVWRCIWHYEWSDGTWASPAYTEYNSSPCGIGNP